MDVTGSHGQIFGTLCLHGRLQFCRFGALFAWRLGGWWFGSWSLAVVVGSWGVVSLVLHGLWACLRPLLLVVHNLTPTRLLRSPQVLL